MSTLKTNKISGVVLTTTEAPFDVQIGPNSLPRAFTINFTVDSTGALPDSAGAGGTAEVGHWFYDSTGDSTNDVLKFYVNDSIGWVNLGLTDSSGAVSTPPSWMGDRAGFQSAVNPAVSGWHNNVDYLSIDTLGNATDLGNDYGNRRNCSGTSNGSRGLVFGGNHSSYYQLITYHTIAVPGDYTDFGSMNAPGQLAGGALGDGTYAVATCTRSTSHNQIDYVTVATTGNATDFGDLTVPGTQSAAANDATRGLFMGRYYGSTQQSVMDYITIATPGNAIDFGDLATPRTRTAFGIGDETYGIYAGGYNGSSREQGIDYVTIQTTGNMTNFGNLTVGKSDGGSANSPTNGGTGRGLFAGGYSTTYVQAIDYITTASTGNAGDFGDLSAPMSSIAGFAGSSS